MASSSSWTRPRHSPLGPLPTPSYEDLRELRQCVRPSIDFYRLRWYLSRPVSTRIHVLASAFDSTSAQSPYEPSPGAYHPISQSAVSCPPVSSITVTVNRLDYWADDWDDAHHYCIEEEEQRIGTCSDGVGRPVHCCGEDRPDPGPSLVVVPTNQPFVTIHDYVTAVHPWLLRVEPDIRNAFVSTPGASLLPNVDLYLQPGVLSPLFILNTKSTPPTSEAVLWSRLAEKASRQAVQEEESVAAADEAERPTEHPPSRPGDEGSEGDMLRSRF